MCERVRESVYRNHKIEMCVLGVCVGVERGKRPGLAWLLMADQRLKHTRSMHVKHYL